MIYIFCNQVNIFNFFQTFLPIQRIRKILLDLNSEYLYSIEIIGVWHVSQLAQELNTSLANISILVIPRKDIAKDEEYGSVPEKETHPMPLHL